MVADAILEDYSRKNAQTGLDPRSLDLGNPVSGQDKTRMLSYDIAANKLHQVRLAWQSACQDLQGM